jgi:tetratricopeptide (TPR) repeat protein
MEYTFFGRFLLRRFSLLVAIFISLLPCAAGFVYAQAETAESVLIKVSEYLAVSKFNEAIALFDKIPSPEKEGSDILLLKASVLSSAGKYAEARAIAEGISAKEPQNTEPLFVLAAIEAVSGRQRQQQAALEKIIKIQPDNAEALVALGNVSLQTRAFRAAANYFDSVLRKDPRNADALIGLSRAYRMNTEWENAEILLNEVVKLYPDMVEARTERGRFYWGRGYLLQALNDYDAAVKLAGGDYWIAIDRGSLLLEMNRKPQALEDFKRAIEINPNEYRAYAYSAGLKDDLGDSSGAERDYAILARLKPDYYFALEGLGLHKMRNGNWAEARDAFMEAYRQAPDEHHYGLLAAINQMRAENTASPRAFLAQIQAKVTRETLLWYMVRLFYDLTARNYLGENDMVTRLDKTSDPTLKARMMFYMALYYDVRGNTNTANMYYQLVSETKAQTIPEWRLNEWILADRGLKTD